MDDYLLLKKQRERFMTILGLSEGGNLNYNKRIMIDRLVGNFRHDRQQIRNDWQNSTMLEKGHYAMRHKDTDPDPFKLMMVIIIECCNCFRLAQPTIFHLKAVRQRRRSCWTT